MIKDRLLRRHLHIKKKVRGTPERPRLKVMRSNRHIYAILIDDTKNKVITSVGSLTKELLTKRNEFKGKVAVAKEVGRLIAEKAKKLNIEKVAFDRGGYKYHGRIKALAEGAREGGLKF